MGSRIRYLRVKVQVVGIFSVNSQLQIIQERKKQLADCEGKAVKEGGSQAKSLNFLDQILTILRQDGTYFPDKEISDHLYGIVAAVSYCHQNDIPS